MVKAILVCVLATEIAIADSSCWSPLPPPPPPQNKLSIYCTFGQVKDLPACVQFIFLRQQKNLAVCVPFVVSEKPLLAGELVFIGDRQLCLLSALARTPLVVV